MRQDSVWPKRSSVLHINMMAPSAITWKRLNCNAIQESGLLQEKEKCDESSGIFLRSIFLVRTGCILVHQMALFAARDGLKGTATTGSVRGLGLRPFRISAFQITEFHWHRFPSYSPTQKAPHSRVGMNALGVIRRSSFWSARPPSR